MRKKEKEIRKRKETPRKRIIVAGVWKFIAFMERDPTAREGRIEAERERGERIVNITMGPAVSGETCLHLCANTDRRHGSHQRIGRGRAQFIMTVVLALSLVKRATTTIISFFLYPYSPFFPFSFCFLSFRLYIFGWDEKRSFIS